MPKQLVQTVREVSFIFKRKNNDTIGNNFNLLKPNQN